MFILIIFIINQMITKFKTNEILQINMSEKFVKCLSSEIPAMTSSKYKASNILKEDCEEELTTFSDRILNIELAKILPIKTKKEESTENEVPQVEQNQEEDTESPTIETNVATNVQTEIVTQNPIGENNKVEINGVKIKNQTSFEIN